MVGMCRNLIEVGDTVRARVNGRGKVGKVGTVRGTRDDGRTLRSDSSSFGMACGSFPFEVAS